MLEEYNMTVEEQIAKLQNDGYLSSFKPCFFDSWCGEPVSWGYEILKRMGDDMWAETSHLGRKECAYGSGGNWYLITKYLSKEEAISKYGEVTKTDRGPRGGYRSETYGLKTFSTDLEYNK